MTRFLRWTPLSLLILLLLGLLAACSNLSNTALPGPTPAGQPAGKPTFVYLYSSP